MRTAIGRCALSPLFLDRLWVARLGRVRAITQGEIDKPMLRITVQEDGAVWRLHLAGRLASVWVGMTETIWHSAQPCGKQVEIDMREVTGIDEAGRCLLRAMNEAGASLIAKGVAMEALVEEITGKPARLNRTAQWNQR